MEFKNLGLVMVAWGAILTDVSWGKAELVLIEKGNPKAQIVVAEEASEQSQQAAQVLQEYLEKMSGARLEIGTETQEVSGPQILVGPSQAVRQLGVEVPSGFTNQIKEEGFVIKTVGDHLVIAGNEDWHYRGTIYGVYDFLEQLGCRWFFPGPYGEVVPHRTTVAIGDLDIEEHPSFRLRNIWYSGWMPVDEQDGSELKKWYDGNKLHALTGLSTPGDGSIIRLAPPEKYFKTHPHIYALQKNGERSREMLCLTEPDTVRIAVQTITETFRNDPEAFTFGFAPPDGHPWCCCERCQKGLQGFTGKGYGDPSLSDLWFRFVNQVAQEVKKEFPDHWLLTNGYANRVRVPEGVGKLSDNIGLQWAVIQACTLHPIGHPKCWQRQEYEQLLRRWTEELNCVFIYDYDPGKGLDNLPFPALHNLKHDLPFLKQQGVWGFWTEGQNAWMVTHLNYYVRAQLMWNVEEDVEALVRDYCEKFYGKAADPIERYIWTLEEAVHQAPVHLRWGETVPWKRILSRPVRRSLDALMASAQSLADTPEDQLHVRVYSLVHQHMKAFLEMQNAADRGDFPKAVGWVEEMQRLREEVAQVDPALLPSVSDWCRGHSNSLEWFRRIYQELADRTGGARGELITMLPREWEFKPDPREDGQIHQWYLPGRGGEWDRLDITTYWQLQGYQDASGWGYRGQAWYRTRFHVPAEAQGKPLMLIFGGIRHQGLWIWANGQLIDYREQPKMAWSEELQEAVKAIMGTPEYFETLEPDGGPAKSSADSRWPFAVDVRGQIRPGEMNTVAVRVNSPPPGQSLASGMYRWVFLWSPR